MSRKSNITVTSRSESAKNRAIAQLRENPVLARRLASGNLQGGGSIQVPLKEADRWYTRRDNQLADPNMFYRLIHEMGYQPVTAGDLEDGTTPAMIGYRENEAGYLVQGPVGQEEMLFKMDKADRALLDQAMTTANLRGVGSAAKIKADLAEAAGSQFGAEGGDYINSLSGQVVDQLANIE